jgi:hypothetical protein
LHRFSQLLDAPAQRGARLGLKQHQFWHNGLLWQQPKTRSTPN